MPDGGVPEAALTADYNAEMLEHRARYPRLRDRSIFVGNPDDVVADRFGPGPAEHPRLDRAQLRILRLRDRRPRPVGTRSAAALRRRLGLADGQRLCVVTVGGTGVGDALLHRVLDAVPHARAGSARICIS